jgi:hypothetical protein
MQRVRFDVVFGVVAIAALAFAAWMYISAERLGVELENARAASRVFENAALEKVDAAENARAAAETGIADLNAQLADTKKENDASRKQIEQQLTTAMAAKEAAEGKLKDANEQLTQLKAAKEVAEAEAAQAKNDLEKERAAREAAELRAAPPPQAPPAETPQPKAPSPQQPTEAPQLQSP